MKILKLIRHGDLVFAQIDKLPDNLTAKKTDTILTGGSGGNPHTFKGGKFYPKREQNIIGYLEAKKTKLFHREHSSEGASIPNGFYEIRRQIEFRENGEQFVED